MKKTTFACTGLLAVLLFSLPASSQVVTLATTTTSVAVAAKDKTICLTSPTGVLIPGVGSNGSTLFLADPTGGESVVARSVTSASASCFNITRSNRPVDHALGTTVYIGANNQFQTVSPAGSCTLASLAVHPWINQTLGLGFKCQNSAWVPLNYTPRPVGLVAGLPVCNATSEGSSAGVTDALTPVTLSAVAGGGAIHTSVYCSGAAWIVQ
jgi:hypothetical protein